MNILRDKIDKIDEKIFLLLKKRFLLSSETVFFKQKIRNSKREKEIILNIKNHISDKDLKCSIEKIYKEILKQSVLYQRFYANKIKRKLK